MRIRPAELSDRDFILDLVPRLLEFGGVPGRDPVQMIDRDRVVLMESLHTPTADTSIFIAEDTTGGGSLGLIHLTTAADYYTDSRTAHVADLVVAPAADRRGVGTALLEFAEGWARERGFALLTLNVFVANTRARALYARRGFQEEFIRCVKRL
jgi:GNAT superfamily N-acetyltransferase